MYKTAKSGRRLVYHIVLNEGYQSVCDLADCSERPKLGDHVCNSMKADLFNYLETPFVKQ